jgi:CDP-diacylglycerol--glycerol-3-phosphate 3-phosphatidyltransferase
VFIVLLRFPRVLEVMPTWFVVVVVAREFLVTTLRGLAEGCGIPFPADRLGKWKMVAQCILAGALLTMVAGTDLFRPLAGVLLWVTLALTVVSGAAYTWKARGLLFAAT